MKIRTEVKIGIIVLATIALVIFGINYLKGKNVLKRTDVYYTVFNDISGLKLSSSIFISGMKIGLINSIAFKKNDYNQIVVALAINKGVVIPRNSIVELYSSDFLGNKALKIIPSKEKENARFGDTLSSHIQMDLFASLQSELVPFKDKAESAISSLDSLISSLNNVLDPAMQKNLQHMVNNLEESTGSLAIQLGSGGKLEQTINNLAVFSGVLNDNKEKLNSIFENMEEITDSVAKSNIKNALLNMDRTFEQTQKLLSGINEGKGSLGLLTTSDSIYKNIQSATANLSTLLEDLEKNPKRYVHFSIFGKKNKPQ
jgi:phospholipid/cholesterol/gamma-HCH transport system substrate-binding protein